MRRSDRISRLTTTLAMLLSLAITVVVPAGYFAVSYHYMQGTLDAEAATGAAAVSALVNSNPSMWQFEQIRLSELLDRRLTTVRLNRGGSLMSQTTPWPRVPTSCRSRFSPGPMKSTMQGQVSERSWFPVPWRLFFGRLPLLQSLHWRQVCSSTRSCAFCRCGQ